MNYEDRWKKWIIEESEKLKMEKRLKIIEKRCEKLTRTNSSKNIVDLLKNREQKGANPIEMILKHKQQENFIRKRFAKVNKKYERLHRLERKCKHNAAFCRDELHRLRRIKKKGYQYCDMISRYAELADNVCSNLMSNVAKVNKLIRHYQRSFSHSKLQLQKIKKSLLSMIKFWSDLQSSHSSVPFYSSESDLSSTEDELEEEKSKNCDSIDSGRNGESDHSISSVSTVYFRHIDSISSTDQTSSSGSP